MKKIISMMLIVVMLMNISVITFAASKHELEKADTYGNIVVEDNNMVRIVKSPTEDGYMTIKYFKQTGKFEILDTEGKVMKAPETRSVDDYKTTDEIPAKLEPKGKNALENTYDLDSKLEINNSMYSSYTRPVYPGPMSQKTIYNYEYSFDFEWWWTMSRPDPDVGILGRMFFQPDLNNPDAIPHIFEFGDYVNDLDYAEKKLAIQLGAASIDVLLALATAAPYGGIAQMYAVLMAIGQNAENVEVEIILLNEAVENCHSKYMFVRDNYRR